MFTLERRLGHVLLAATLVASTPVLAEQQDQQGAAKTLELGRAPTGGEIRAWDIDVAPDGAGLPDGAGRVFAFMTASAPTMPLACSSQALSA